MKRALLAALAAVVVAPTAFAHGGGNPGFLSTVTALRPPVTGLRVTVLDWDDRLRLENESGRTIVIEGYEGEPYLRFAADGVYRNTRSPAVYLNESRYGEVELPSAADPDAPPEWEKVAGGSTYEWHDHRVHWMSPIPPPRVQAAPDERHHIFDWSVPAEVDGRPLAIAGTLDYTPAGGATNWTLIVGSGIAVCLTAAGLGVVRRRRRHA